MMLASVIPLGSSRSRSRSASGIWLFASVLATAMREVALTSAARVLSMLAIEDRRWSISIITIAPAPPGRQKGAHGSGRWRIHAAWAVRQFTLANNFLGR